MTEQITQKSIHSLHAALKGIGLTPAKVTELGITNVQITSPRTLRFDLPDGKAKDGINRVKLTGREDGTVDIRFIEVNEHELVGGVAPEGVQACVEAFTGLKLA